MREREEREREVLSIAAGSLHQIDKLKVCNALIIPTTSQASRLLLPPLPFLPALYT